MKNFLIALLLLIVPALARAEDTTFVPWIGLQGGEDAAHAVPLPAGRTLRLNHYQFKGRYDYFSIDLKAGQTLALGLAVGAKGIRVLSDGTFQETDHPHAGLFVRDSQGRLLGEIQIDDERTVQKALEVDVSSPQRFYILVGSPVEGTHKDQFIFRANVKDNFDGGGGRDAGSTPQTAVTLSANGSYSENFLTTNDDADYFHFAVVPGKKVKIQVVPENSAVRLLVSLYNEVFQEIARGRSLRPGEAARLEVEPSSSMLYLRVYRDVGDGPTKYAVVFPENLPPLVKSPVAPQSIYHPKFLSRSKP